MLSPYALSFSRLAFDCNSRSQLVGEIETLLVVDIVSYGGLGGGIRLRRSWNHVDPFWRVRESRRRVRTVRSTRSSVLFEGNEALKKATAAAAAAAAALKAKTTSSIILVEYVDINSGIYHHINDNKNDNDEILFTVRNSDMKHTRSIIAP